MGRTYVMILVDEDFEVYYKSATLSGLFRIAEEKDIIFTLQGYSKRILGVNETNDMACLITEDMEIDKLKLLGIMHFDISCHLQKLYKEVTEVLKWDMGDGNIIYTNQESNTVSIFSRITCMPVHIGRKFKLIETMSIDAFVKEAQLAN